LRRGADPRCRRALILAVIGLALWLPPAWADDTLAVDNDGENPAISVSVPQVRALGAADFPPPSVLSSGPRVEFSSRGTQSVGLSRRSGTGPNPYRAIVAREAAAFGLPPEFLEAVMATESGYDPGALGADGEIGLMQIMPATARMLGFAGSLSELAVPEINIHYGARYLAGAWLLGKQDICTAAMKYRAGHGETRFSFRSVEYCARVRAGLAARGYPVSGVLPQPTFGAPALIRARGRGLAGKSGGVDLGALNNRLRAITMTITAVRAR